MLHDERNRKHFKNVQNETDNPAIWHDVIDGEMEQHTGQHTTKASPLSPVQEIVRNNTDGKTWQNVDK